MSTASNSTSPWTTDVGKISARTIKAINRETLRRLGYGPDDVEKVEGISDITLKNTFRIKYDRMFGNAPLSLDLPIEGLEGSIDRLWLASVKSLGSMALTGQIGLDSGEFIWSNAAWRIRAIVSGPVTVLSYVKALQTVVKTDPDWQRLRSESFETALEQAMAHEFFDKGSAMSSGTDTRSGSSGTATQDVWDPSKSVDRKKVKRVFDNL